MIRILAIMVALALAPACHSAKPEPMKLEGNLLTVDNRTKQEWTNVEVWLNYHYRVTTKSLLPYGRLEVPLNVFVAGYGQKFDWRHQQITDLRLKATLPDGSPLEIKKEFQSGGLSDALSGVGKKK